MCHYTHLTPFEREKILFFLAEGKSITEIAHLLKRSKSTISRELRRNAAPVDQPMPYCPLTAIAQIAFMLPCLQQRGTVQPQITADGKELFAGSSTRKTPCTPK